MQLGWKSTGMQEELWVHPRSREPGAWLCVQHVLCREAGMQKLSLASHISNGLCVLLQRTPSQGPVLISSLSYLLFGDIMFAHLCGSWSWFLIPASAQQWHWQEVSSPGWLTGTICCPGTFSPLSVVKNPGGRTGSAWAG